MNQQISNFCQSAGLPEQGPSNQQKLDTVFDIIKQALIYNRCSTIELREKLVEFYTQHHDEKQQIVDRVLQNENNLGQVVFDARQVFNELQTRVSALENSRILQEQQQLQLNESLSKAFLQLQNLLSEIQCQNALQFQELKTQISVQNQTLNLQKTPQIAKATQAQQPQRIKKQKQSQQQVQKPELSSLNASQQLQKLQMAHQSKLQSELNQNFGKQLSVLDTQLRSLISPVFNSGIIQQSEQNAGTEKKPRTRAPKKKRRLQQKENLPLDQNQKVAEIQKPKIENQSPTKFQLKKNLPQEQNSTNQNSVQQISVNDDQWHKVESSCKEKNNRKGILKNNFEKNQRQNQKTPALKKDSPPFNVQNQGKKPSRIMVETYQKMVENSDNYQVADVPHDGNCFYSALAVLLGYPIQSYRVIKQRLYSYIIEKQFKYDYCMDINLLSDLIIKEGAYATYDVLKLAADHFKRALRLYYQRYPGGKFEEFGNDSGEAVGEPLRMIFTGNWDNGHFMAIVPKTAAAPQEPSVMPSLKVVTPGTKPMEAIKTEVASTKAVAQSVKPVAPSVKPVAPSVKPNAPCATTTASSVKPVTPTVKPVAPCINTMAPAIKSVLTCANTVAPSVKPVAPCASTVVSSAMSAAPARKEVTPPHKKVVPCVKQVTQVITAERTSGNLTKPLGTKGDTYTITYDVMPQLTPILGQQQISHIVQPQAQPQNLPSVVVDNEVYYECDQQDFGQINEELAHNTSKISSAATASVPTMSYPTDKMADYVQRSRSKSIKKTTEEKAAAEEGLQQEGAKPFKCGCEASNSRTKPGFSSLDSFRFHVNKYHYGQVPEGSSHDIKGNLSNN